ncbi:hypothetical protein CAC42_5710 [Sphaceloma murrayae]|uniref:Glycosyl transferase CAP10 domain-containing protein n=1 Tax=Sphaceloma murrayae TaxID=2082308 RepID=A0A2K1QZ44_9PEZI|nr:hypothetical protein CAC42_5710 [Sphaceloma murrayae]
MAAPPGFDKWYRYAIDRNSSVIDDFDSIMRDLRPFESLTPILLRQRTAEARQDPFNDVSAIIIRNGKAMAHPDVRDTHRWMMEGVISMISRFEEFLPDMDLAFNTNDEPRVITKAGGQPGKLIPAADSQLRKSPADILKISRSYYSKDRAASWGDQLPIERGVFEHLSFQNVFYSFGVYACSRQSKTRYLWDHSQLCSSCMTPHSDGVFLRDWKLSNEPCHQPDLAMLHGLYSSPAAFKGTHDLFPIFSQSKAPHFDDILYPSAWNYQDKAVYAPSLENPDPPFPNKNATLFWRGSTTEGVSPGSGVWTGFARQRFHQILNSLSSAPAFVLLPTNPTTWHHTYLTPSALHSHLPADMKFIDPIQRCGEPDCTRQAADLGPLVGPSDFQSHWSYKYLLDLDGAGFSGRFLPFLYSRSLPFKAALFREWYDDRLRAWTHFVPLDLRGTGLWATLLYFAGWRGVGAHEVEGERIAEEGRRWAGKVLRKEDMEIYMFRLLLEWGRLTDDAREEMGLSLEEARRIEQAWEREGWSG